jgi:hypothetical protein
LNSFEGPTGFSGTVSFALLSEATFLDDPPKLSAPCRAVSLVVVGGALSLEVFGLEVCSIFLALEGAGVSFCATSMLLRLDLLPIAPVHYSYVGVRCVPKITVMTYGRFLTQ